MQPTHKTSIRPYAIAYSENLKGGTVMFGNTMMHIVNNGVVGPYKYEPNRKALTMALVV